MSVATRWWWVRHAPVTVYGGRIYGQRDVPADTSDAAAFAVLAASLPAGAQWITSNLQRAQQTAEAIGEAGLAFEAPFREADFAEQNFGEWQGRDRAETFRRHGDRRGFWLAPVDQAPPGGESFVQLMDRTTAAIERWSGELAGRDIVCVSHGGPIKAAIGHALGLEADAAVAFNIDNLSLTRLDRIETSSGIVAWQVQAVNRTPVAANRKAA